MLFCGLKLVQHYMSHVRMCHHMTRLLFQLQMVVRWINLQTYNILNLSLIYQNAILIRFPNDLWSMIY